MVFWLRSPVSAFQIAQGLNLSYEGEDIEINKIAAFKHIVPGCISYSTEAVNRNSNECLIIAPLGDVITHGCLVSNNPRLDFIRALNWLADNDFLPYQKNGSVHSNVMIHPSAVIDKGAVIGSGCIIGPHSHIRSQVVLGMNITIGSSVSIGHDGFGYERDNDGIPHHFPHLGHVFIDDNVAIGNFCSIARGNLENTHIKHDVKIDDHVYIAHNVCISEKTLVMSGVHVNGGVHVGHECWLGTGSLIREGTNVGDKAIVGMGSVVVSTVQPKTTVIGSPARMMVKNK